MADDWSPEEVAATVADYFLMLAYELRGESYNKSEHNRNLQQLLRGRSAGAIEFKHANISAILIEEGFPYIDGYKPRSNYQERLRQEVTMQLVADSSVVSAADQAVSVGASTPPLRRELGDVIVPAPVREKRPPGVYERPTSSNRPRLGINYLERESKNASLGAAGETFVLEMEHRRLWEAGMRSLADRIEHVSVTRGDGLGYDIESFETDGAERLIEVKTTSFGVMTPFYASRREVLVSEERAQAFHLYRLFKFRDQPKMFVLDGALTEHCILDPVQYQAMLR